jgi:hypothetical protein
MARPQPVRQIADGQYKDQTPLTAPGQKIRYNFAAWGGLGCDVSSEEELVEMVVAKISKIELQISRKGWRGSRANSGGRRPGSGRKKGTPNKVTAEIKQLGPTIRP